MVKETNRNEREREKKKKTRNANERNPVIAPLSTNMHNYRNFIKMPEGGRLDFFFVDELETKPVTITTGSHFCGDESFVLLAHR